MGNDPGAMRAECQRGTEVRFLDQSCLHGVRRAVQDAGSSGRRRLGAAKVMHRSSWRITSMQDDICIERRGSQRTLQRSWDLQVIRTGLRGHWSRFPVALGAGFNAEQHLFT